MNIKKFYLLIGMVLMAGFLPQKNVSADMGPKPTMDFQFVDDVSGSKLTIVSWSLINCENSECANTGEIIPAEFGFNCGGDHCRTGVYYGLRHKYFQMEITFSDGITRKSNVFTRRYFDALYSVTVTPDALFVKELRGNNANRNLLALVFVGGFFFYPATLLVIFIASITVVASGAAKKIGRREIFKRLGKVIFWAIIVDMIFTGLVLSAATFILTLTIEISLTLVYWWYLKLPDKKLLYGVLLANVFTQPVFVLLQADLGLGIHLNSMIGIVIAESVIWLVETVIIYFFQKKELSFTHILALAFVLNAASFGIGLLLPI